MSSSLWGKESRPKPIQRDSDFDPGEGTSRGTSRSIAATVKTSHIAEVMPLMDAMPSRSTNGITFLSQEVTTTLTKKTSKKNLISLDPFEDDGGIDFESIEDEVEAKFEKK